MSLNKDLNKQILDDDKSSSDIFNFKNFYELEDGAKFSGFDTAILDNLKPFLQSQGVSVKLKTKYKQNPELLSFDEYGTPDFWYVILYVNNLFTKLDFILEQIFIPSRSAIAYMVNQGLEKSKRQIKQ